MKLFPFILLFAGCVSFPSSDLVRGACTVTYPDREDICLEVPQLACIAAMGEYFGDGSTCGDLQGYDFDQIVEPSPIYLDQKVIYSVGGTITAIAAAWAGNVVRRRKKIGIK